MFINVFNIISNVTFITKLYHHDVEPIRPGRELYRAPNVWDETAQLNPTAQVWKSCHYHYIPGSSSFKMLTMTTILTMLPMMKMITRSSPHSPPLPSPPQDPWTGDPVLRSSTTISPFQGFYNLSCRYFDNLVDDITMILILICSRQRPSSLKKSASLASTTSPHSFLGSNQNPHLATATEITRF